MHPRGVVLALGLLGSTLALASSQQALKPKALHEMVESERAFAKMAAEQGIRPAFLKYFGEEGVGFSPAPYKFRPWALRNPLPDPPPPREWQLEWWPVYGDISEAGDMGYNTGPTVFTDLTPKKRPSNHGYFFSVWRRQADGSWSVAADMGSGTPGPDPAHADRMKYERAPQAPAKKIKPKSPEAGREEMIAAEAAFQDAVRAGAAQAYSNFFASYGRLHRPLNFPVLGKENVARFIDEHKAEVKEWEGMDGAVAASGELGYTYGRYRLNWLEPKGVKDEKGFFTRVWKRDRAGAWKVVAEVWNPDPPIDR